MACYFHTIDPYNFLLSYVSRFFLSGVNMTILIDSLLSVEKRENTLHLGWGLMRISRSKLGLS